MLSNPVPPVAFTPKNQDPHRGVNMMTVPVIAVKLHAIVKRVENIEERLGKIPLEAYRRSATSPDYTHDLVKSVMELDEIRQMLLGLEPSST